MKPNAICPISFNKIDENAARLNATFTLILLTLYLATTSILPILFLLIDFSLRGAELSSLSPLTILSKNILKNINIKSKPVNAGPKIFASRIGVVFAMAIILFNIVDLDNVAFIFMLVFSLCALLEAAFSFCVACKIYPYVYKFTYQFNFDKVKI